VNRKVLVIGLAAVLPLVGVLLANIDRDPNPSLQRSPMLGRTAPPFSLVPVGGGPPVSLEALRGRPVVVNFWATWCAPCMQEHEVLQQAARAHGAQVQFLGVVYDDEESRVRQFLARYGTAYPSLLDDNGRTAIAYGVYGVPETYFIDAQGQIVQKYSFPLDEPTMAQYLSQIAPPRAAAEAR
jgi:cytochrome c biogenesis protein CcmG/thiol:disulfide interchange protein DsbE